MKQILKWVFWGLFLVPLLVWLYLSLTGGKEMNQLAKVVKPVEAIAWGEGADRLSVRVRMSVKAEKEQKYYLIEVVGADGNPRQKYTLVINLDIWGGGFVKAMDVDDDGELELVAWDTRNGFFLDYSAGAVVQKPWSEASPSARSVAMRFFSAETDDNVLELFLVALVGFYLLSGMIVLIVMGLRSLWRRKEQK